MRERLPRLRIQKYPKRTRKVIQSFDVLASFDRRFENAPVVSIVIAESELKSIEVKVLFADLMEGLDGEDLPAFHLAFKVTVEGVRASAE
jgi:hypothetical protein